MAHKLYARQLEHIAVRRHGDSLHLVPTDILRRAIERAHKNIDRFAEFDVDVFLLLGMRNLSSFIGELFAAAIVVESGGLFCKNPHQDGYPDLLLMDELGQRQWTALRNRLREKAPFSPFLGGGIEVKATCGSVPTPVQCAKLGVEKPDLGDQRIAIMRAYDWKAHHRETNNLIGILWDFMGGVPRLVAVFYSNSLETEDWGAIVKPKDGGGRTTSVSIMTRQGIAKMYAGWLFVATDSPYVQFIDRYNRASTIRDDKGKYEFEIDPGVG